MLHKYLDFTLLTLVFPVVLSLVVVGGCGGGAEPLATLFSAEAPDGLVWRSDGFWTCCATDDTVRHYSRSGNLIATYSVPFSGDLTGLAWDGANWWIAENVSNTIYKLDAAFGVVQSYASPTSQPVGLDWAQGTLWMCDNATDRVYRLTVGASTITIAFTYPAGNPDPRGLAWDGTNMWSCSAPGGSGASGRREVYKHDTDGDIIETHAYSAGYIEGIAFVGSSLYCADNELNQIMQATFVP